MVIAIGIAIAALAGCRGAGRRPRERGATDDATVAPAARLDAAAAAAIGIAADAGAAIAADAGLAPPPAGWTDVAVALPDVVLDLRYATAHNLTGAPLYPRARCLLRSAVAERLARAVAVAGARGHRLLLWDCYRPASAQRELWRRVADPRFVAEPRFAADGTPITGSRHSRGAAIDVSLAAPDGAPRPMPTDHDDFGPDASGARATGVAARNLADLRAAMTAAGLVPLASEWWHFEAPDATAYPLADEPLR